MALSFKLWFFLDRRKKNPCFGFKSHSLRWCTWRAHQGGDAGGPLTRLLCRARLWLSRHGNSSSNRKVVGSVPQPPLLHIEVSSIPYGRRWTLKLFQMSRPAPCPSASAIRVRLCGWMGNLTSVTGKALQKCQFIRPVGSKIRLVPIRIIADGSRQKRQTFIPNIRI